MWGDIAIAFMIAFMTSFMATPHTINFAKKLGAVDTPKDNRRINKITMPRPVSYTHLRAHETF